MDKLSLSNYTFNKDITGAFFPPILDYNAISAAQDLTKTDMEFCYEHLKKAFSTLSGRTKKHPILYDCLMYSYTNFMWFATFFKELEKILNVSETFVVPYDEAPESMKVEPPLFFFPPFHLEENPQKKFKPVEDNIKIYNRDVVNLYRVRYILNDYELEDFIDGFPNWFIFKQQTVFETYNEKTNVRVRVDYMNGEFLYFVAGASDNWQIVNDVPTEIDHITSALLFKN